MSNDDRSDSVRARGAAPLPRAVAISVPAAEPPPKDRRELYERIARGGKQEVIVEEMVRLGFWSGPVEADPPDEIRRIREIRARLGVLGAAAAKLRDIAKLELELHKQRLAASRKRREETKQQRLAARAAARAETQQKKTRELAYLGERVSAGLGEGRRTSDAARLAAQDLPIFHSAADLAAGLGVPLGELRFLAFAREVSTTTHYRRFTIPKRTGGVRVIAAPMARLKRAQHWILARILDRLAFAEPAHGFRAGRSIVSNAAPHVGAAVVINVDLRDFFPTVTYRRVKGLYRRIGYSEEVATVLGLLCTEPDIVETELDGVTYYVARGERRLPQGAPTSPAITNALCSRLDRRLAGWAARHAFAYTRYADDLTLSTHDPAARPGSCLAFVRKLVAAEGFCVHPDKVRVVRRARRQEVTGIVVNQRLAVPRVELRKFRALLHHLEKDGPAGKTWPRVPSAPWHGNLGPPPLPRPLNRGGAGGDIWASALGFASFVAMVDPAKGAALRERVLAIRAKHA